MDPFLPDTRFKIRVPLEVRKSGIVWLKPEPEESGSTGSFMARIFRRFVPKRTNTVRLDPMGSGVVRAMLDGMTYREILDEVDDGTPDLEPRVQAYLNMLIINGFVEIDEQTQK